MAQPKVAVLMGSDSDWDVMSACVEQLKEFGLAAEVRVCSAHRTPADVEQFVKSANHVRVFIAAAGMSAALAGTIAALTARPVIGVPIESGPLRGFDALLSTVQMPPGVPVAAVAIGKSGARNAAILAAQILSTADDALAQRLVEFKAAQAEGVRQKHARLQATLS